MTRTLVLGTFFGATAGIAVLVAAAILLLMQPETSAKVLVAVWLWSLPVLGFGAAMGWSIARLAQRLVSQ
jgi:hypothetical protein